MSLLQILRASNVSRPKKTLADVGKNTKYIEVTINYDY